MKILHINTERTWRGGEQQTLYLLRSLKDRQIHCHLVSQPDTPMTNRAAAAGIEVIPVAMHGEADLAAGIRLNRLIRTHRYDIVHSHTSHAHTLAFMACIGRNICRLVTRRVDFTIFRNRFLALNAIKYRYMADYYIAISHKIKSVMVSDGIAADRIFVVHSGIDLNRFAAATKDHLISEFGLNPEAPVIINVAHLAGHKGQQFLVRAIPLVLKEVPDARFFIVGKGELMAELQSLAGSLGINQSLTFTGFRKDVGAFYKLADVFVMSSVQEGLGTAVLDALALGKPVVGTNAGGIPEIIKDGETGRLVAAGNPQALAHGIIQMLAHREDAQKMAQRGQAMVKEQFSIEAMVDNNIAVYRQLLAPENRR
jgi:glycosyltransferase involved in cell wall biosynthesis